MSLSRKEAKIFSQLPSWKTGIVLWMNKKLLLESKSDCIIIFVKSVYRIAPQCWISRILFHIWFPSQLRFLSKQFFFSWNFRSPVRYPLRHGATFFLEILNTYLSLFHLFFVIGTVGKALIYGSVSRPPLAKWYYSSILNLKISSRLPY